MSDLPEPFVLPGRDRFARHHGISWWDQDRLAGTMAIVVGCGALGNEVAKNLALIGVGTLILVDFDRIEASNLARSVLFGQEDLGKRKAEVAAARVRHLHPAIRSIAIAGDLRCDLGLGLVRRADLVFGCLDSLNARFALNRLALRAGRPWLDGGLGVDSLQVARYDPRGGACYECQITPAMARRFADRTSCAGLARPDQGPGVPTTAITASLAAALMVEEGLLDVHSLAGRDRSGSESLGPVRGGLGPGQRLTLHLAPYQLAVDDLPVDPDCCAHGALPADLERAGPPDAVSVRDLLGGESGHVDLGFDLVTGLDCPHCGPAVVCTPRARLGSQDARCPACGAERVLDWTRTVSGEILLAERSLRELGVPDHHIVGVHGASDRFVELGGSILPSRRSGLGSGSQEWETRS